MAIKDSVSGKVFNVFNVLFLSAFALLCLFPFINILSVSFSSSVAASANMVALWPVEFTTKAYEFVVQKPDFITAVGVSVKRVLLGGVVNMVLIIMTAYPLSKEASKFKFRSVYAWFFVFTMIFSGGLVPQFMVVYKLGLVDTLWALILPGALPVFNVTMLLNFFRGVPKELEEASFMDGANHWILLWKIYLPISMPAIATIMLFVVVGHWNSWFDGLIYMNKSDHYPLQSYLQTLVIRINPKLMSAKNVDMLKFVSERTVKSAQIFLGALPILIVYPFLQRYFMKGIVLGSVKG